MRNRLTVAMRPERRTRSNKIRGAARRRFTPDPARSLILRSGARPKEDPLTDRHWYCGRQLRSRHARVFAEFETTYVANGSLKVSLEPKRRACTRAGPPL